MLISDDGSIVAQEPSGSPKGRSIPVPSSRRRDELPYDGTIRLVGHRVREVQPGMFQVETQVSCEGRTFTGAASGSSDAADRLRVPAIATLRALEACLQVFYLGVSHPTLVLDDVAEVSVDDLTVVVVMVTASEGAHSTPVVAAAPLVGMTSDPAIILATLQASSRIVSHWLTWGDRFLPATEQDRPQ